VKPALPPPFPNATAAAFAPECRSRGGFSQGLLSLSLQTLIFVLEVLHSIYIGMILTTTPSVEGHPIREYRDIISAETIIGANFVKDFFARLTDVFGGRSNSYERVLREGKETALAELRKAAQDVGGNAVVGVKLDYETVGASGSMLMVVATGTAVVI